MTWLQIDDNMMDHPKILALPDAAFRLHITALCYCARHLTDGVLTREAFRKCSAGVPRTSRARSVKRLIEAGLWMERADGYEIHDYLDWNPSREKILSKRKARSEAGKQGAANRWERRDSGLSPPKPSMANAIANASEPMANAMAGRNAPSHSQDLELQDQSLSPSTKPPTDHKIQAKDIAAETRYEIERLLEHLPDADKGTSGRLVSLARRGATARHFADARQGITTSSTNGSPSKKACKIIETALLTEVAW